MQRLSICTFWNKNGRLCSADRYFLKKLNESSTKILLVVNGIIEEESSSFLKKEGIEFFVRENKGLDFAAWKQGILYVGLKKILKEYDELIITNLTTYGPIDGSFESLFKKMDSKVCDFWGLTRHPENKSYLFSPSDPDSWCRNHIQSYFLCFKKNLIMSNSFKEFWMSLESASSYEEEVAEHENKLTEYFEKRGYIGETFIDPLSFSIKYNYSVIHADSLLSLGCPLLKRKAFSLDYDYFREYGYTRGVVNAINFIKDKTTYPVQYIFRDVFNKSTPSNVHLNFAFNFVVSEKEATYQVDDSRYCVVYFVFYEDLISENLSVMQNLPKEANIFLVSSKDRLISKYVEELKNLGYSNVQSVKAQSRGRAESAYLVACQHLLEQFEFICYLHDKKTSQAGATVGKEYAHHCYTNVLPSYAFLRNIISLFDAHPELGILEPPSFEIGNEIAQNEKELKKLYLLYRIQSPFDPSPIAPFGTMFWVRSKAFRSLKKVNLSYEDFPQEPVKVDGTMLHAIERFYPTLALDAGYATGWVINEAYAPFWLSKHIHIIRQSANARSILGGIGVSSDIQNQLSGRKLLYLALKKIKRKYLFKVNTTAINKLLVKLLRL